MSTTNRSTWGHRVAGLAMALVLVASACGDGDDDPAASAGSSTTGGESATSSTNEPQADDNNNNELPQASTETSDDEDGDSSNDAPSESTAGATVAEPPTGSDQPWAELPFVLQSVASLTGPTALAARPGSDHIWITERAGRVRLIERDLDAAAGTEVLTQVSEAVLDISDQVDSSGEGGLLGLAFSSDGQRLYLHYTDRDFYNVISEFPMGDTSADASAERILMRIEQPFSNHNGGDLHFGPDGMLYISVGDGGSADDPLGSGQDTTTLLATLLRIDPTPSDDAPYTVPADNPFASGEGGQPEIWTWGLRNPWRFSFDSVTGDLWIGDVGQNQIEEIDFLPASSDGAGRGANMGWNLMEGNQEFAGSAPPDHVGPIHTYGRENGRCSVTGGTVSRGSNSPTLWGVYLFADYCTGEVFGLERNDDGSTTVATLGLDRNAGNVVSFGEGPAGDVYVLDLNGRVARIQSSGFPLQTTISSR